MSKITVERSEDGKDILVSVGQLSEYTGKTSQAFGKYKKDGIPFEQRGGRALYPFGEAIEWMIVNGHHRLNMPTEKDDIGREMLPPDVRKDLADAEIKEHKLAVLKKEYVAASEVIEMGEKIMSTIKTRIMSIGARLAPILATKSDPIEVQKIIDDSNYEALDELSRLTDIV